MKYRKTTTPAVARKHTAGPKVKYTLKTRARKAVKKVAKAVGSRLKGAQYLKQKAQRGQVKFKPFSLPRVGKK